MGIEYGLYCRKTKEYVWLGKEMNGSYQIPSDRISAFVARSWGKAYGSSFEMYSDTMDTPDCLEDGWVLVDYWNREDDDLTEQL